MLKTHAEKMMPAARTIGMLFFALMTGCTGLMDAPGRETARSAPLIVDPSLIMPNRDASVAAEPPRSEPTAHATIALSPPPAEPRQPLITADEAIAIEPAAGAPAPPPMNRNAAKAAVPLAKPPARVSAPSRAIEQPRKNAAPPPVARKSEPPLDVAALKARLRDTNAIGLFTKLALKNQMEDLLQQFRTHYLSGQNTGVAKLRQPYDMLVLKVLALLQDNDPSLARTISGSREAIWGILADPQKFNSAI